MYRQVKWHLSLAAISFNLNQKWQFILSEVTIFQCRMHTRRQLRSLEDWQLADIGITREQAEKEAGKGFWQQ